MTIRYVTTCHLKGWQQYGETFLRGWKHFPADATLDWYTEGYTIPETERVAQIDNGELDELQAFKKRYAFYRSPYYLWDVVRFSHKVYSVHHALRNHSGLGCWIDADMVPHADIPQGYVEGLLQPGDYIAMFRRKGFYSECGFWVVDCDHPQHQAFMDRFLEVYESGEFKRTAEWHDSYLMDLVVKSFEREGLITVTNLSGEHVTAEHPMALHPIARYLDHLKGPDRKVAGVSVENAYRKAA